MYKRIIELSGNHTFFLFGMRGTGKSTLLGKLFGTSNVMWIDLLLAEHDLKYKKNPDLLIAEILGLKDSDKLPDLVVIDEVQKNPALLDVVHYLIENEKIIFALTGSSSRKLKRGGSNLLAGRAFIFNLYPLTYLELGDDFHLNSYLSWGGLPALFAPELEEVKDKIRFLKSYVHTYLKEEILSEQLIRDIDPFYSFLEVSAQMNSEILNFSKIAREAGTNDKSVERYYSILEDTLLGFHLLPYHKSVRKQQISSSKFYYFDIGLVRALRGHFYPIEHQSTYDYGKLFESFVINEIYKINRYTEKDYKLSFLKTKDGVELDLIIGVSSIKSYCIEIKSGIVKNLEDFNTQYKLSKEILNSEFLVFSQNEIPLSNGKIQVVPWQDGIKRLFFPNNHNNNETEP